MIDLTVRDVIEYLSRVPGGTPVVVQWTDSDEKEWTPAVTCVEYCSDSNLVVFKEFIGDPPRE